jgi:short-subunit dehydrogenase
VRAVVTGASAGIGAAFARRLAARGFDLLLVARREDRLRALANEVVALHHIRADIMAADLTRPQDLNKVAEAIRGATDLGVLVNNAGFGTMGYFFEADINGQEKMHRLHVLATMTLSHAALANLVPKAKEGTGIINVSSVAAFGASPQNVSYHATKAWMNAFTEGLATELAGRNSPVTVQALCPGFTLSEFHEVLGMDRSRVAQSLWMTPDYVVQESQRGFTRRKVVVIPGWRYKLLAGLIRIVPAGLLRRVSIAAVRRYRRMKPKDRSSRLD